MEPVERASGDETQAQYYGVQLVGRYGARSVQPVLVLWAPSQVRGVLQYLPAQTRGLAQGQIRGLGGV